LSNKSNMMVNRMTNLRKKYSDWLYNDNKWI
jgi:hypothetical protein